MQLNAKIVGAGFAAAIAAGLGYALFRKDEEIPFDTQMRDGAFSVRAYPQLRVVETIVEGMRESAIARGVMALADFLGVPVAAPVFADGDDDGRGWRTRLVLPRQMNPEAMPVPGEAIRLRALPARRVAAFRFAGDADDRMLVCREADLRYWMETNGLSAAGPVEHAFYNAPFVPAALRRNEVLIPIAG